MKKTYKQTEETKNWLFEALLDIIKTDFYEKITITKICQRAGVPRSTFYRYFNDKDDILRDYIPYFVELFSLELRNYPHFTNSDYIRLNFEFFLKNEQYFKTLYKIHKEHILFDYVSDESLYYNFSGETKIQVMYTGVSFYAIIFSWVIKDHRTSIETMTKFIMENTSQEILDKIIAVFVTAHTKL